MFGLKRQDETKNWSYIDHAEQCLHCSVPAAQVERFNHQESGRGEQGASRKDSSDVSECTF